MEPPAYDVFICFAKADAAWVRGNLLAALDDLRVLTEEGFALGAARVAEFERGVTQSARTLLVLSPAFIAEEGYGDFAKTLAQSKAITSRTNAMIPVIARRSELPLALAGLEALDMSDEATWERDIARLRRELAKPPPEPREPPPCPYPGLSAFGPERAGRFFGREQEIEQLARRVRTQSLLVVIGSSGSGKSSLVIAGLGPRLLARTGERWQVESVRAGAEGARLIELAREAPAAERRLVVVDQIEELFTSAYAGIQAEAIAAIRALAAGEATSVVCTIRADFVGQLIDSDLGSIPDEAFIHLRPLTQEGLRQAITEPATAEGVDIDPALTERLVAECGTEPGFLPFLQVTLADLWECLGQRRIISLASYEALGEGEHSGLMSAIAEHGDGALEKLASDEERDLAKRILLRLVQFGDSGADTRRQQTESELSAGEDPQMTARVIEHLAVRRVLTLSGDTGPGGERVDLAHETLISAWPTLANWIAAQRADEETRRRLAAKVAEWRDGRRDLLGEVELAEARGWIEGDAASELGVPAGLSELVEASEAEIAAAEAAEEAARAARKKRVKVTIGSLVAGLVVLATLAGWAVVQQRQASKQTSVAKSQALAANSLSALPRDPDLGLSLALAAVDEHPTPLAEVQLRSIVGPTAQRRVIRVGAPVSATTFSPDGRTLASADHRGRLTLWNTASGVSERALSAGKRIPLISLAYSPDGAVLATGGDDGVVRLWDPESGTALRRLRTGPSNFVNDIAFSPDGRILATATQDGVVRLWNPTSGILLHTMAIGPQSALYSLAFSPNGHLVAGGADDGAIHVWDVASGRPRWTLEGPEGTSVNGVAFSPNGLLLAGASDDGNVRMWDSASGRSRRILKGGGPRHLLVGLAFAPNGGKLATAGYDGTIHLWDLKSRRVRTLNAGDGRPVNDVAFALDGRLASAGDDGTLRLWDAESGQTLRELSGGDRSLINSLAFSPDSRTLATASVDGARLWDLASGRALGRLTGGFETSADVAFSPDGEIVVSARADGAISVWDVGSQRPLGVLKSRTTAPLDSVAFSPDARRLAGARDDGTVDIWEPDSGRLLQTLERVDEARVNGVAFSPDGRKIATAGDHDARIWDAGSGRLLLTLGGRGGRFVYEVAFSPDGRVLATAGEDGARLWETGSGRALQTLRGGDSLPVGIEFSPDGRTVASPYGSTIQLWDPDSGRSLGIIENSGGKYLNDVGFSPDGRTLASGGYDGIPRIAACRECASAAEVEQAGRLLVARALTIEEQRLYGLGR